MSMNDLNTSFLKTSDMPDVQSSVDHRNIAIDRVGIRGVRHPIQVKTESGVQPSVAMIDLDVLLPGDKRVRTCLASWPYCKTMKHL